MANKQGDRLVLVEVRDVYGVRKAYPANEAATDFAALAGCRTLPSWALAKIRSLGFTVQASNVPEAMLKGVA